MVHYDIILSELIHLFSGGILGCVTYLFGNKNISSRLKFIFLFVICAFSGVFPDILKVLFRDLFTHSIWLSPLVGFLISMFFIKFFSFIRLWMACTVSILAHIGVDFMGNGVALLYPFNQTEYKMFILNSIDLVIPFFLAISLMIGILIYHHPKALLLTFIIGVVFSISYIGYRVVLESVLVEKVSKAYPLPLVKFYTVPESSLKYPFTYVVSSKHFNIMGKATPTAHLIEEYRNFYFEPSSHGCKVTKEYEKNNAKYIVCKHKSGESVEIKTFKNESYGKWEEVKYP